MIEIVRVVAAHPEANAVDVEVIRTGSRLAGVQVLCGMAGADHGFSGLMQPAEQGASDPFSAAPDPARVIYGAVVMAGVPLLLGFLHPQVGQMMFADKNRAVWRHPSDAYMTATDNGDLELSHPSGTFLRIGVSGDHEDLTGKDHDKRWAIGRNTDTSPTLRLKIAAAGSPHTTLTIAPGGQVSLSCDGDLSMDVGGSLSVSAAGTGLIHSAGKLSLTSDDSVQVSAPRVDLN